MINGKKVFDRHPLVASVGFIAAVDSIFYFIGFRESQQLMAVTFILALFITIYYFDKRIQRLERRSSDE